MREAFEAVAREGKAPVLVTSGGIRPFVRGIVERFRAQTPVLSQGEIHPRARLKTVGSIKGQRTYCGFGCVSAVERSRARQDVQYSFSVEWL